MVGREFLRAYQSVNAAVLKFWIVVVGWQVVVCVHQVHTQFTTVQDLRRLKDVW